MFFKMGSSVTLATGIIFTMVGMCLADALHPQPTRGPDPALAIRATTSFYSFVTTEIPRNEYSIGMGLQREGTDEYYWLYCINDAFTTKSGFAGCGTDDLYTKCSGRVATGIDDGEILCDQQCVTHKVYADLDATTFTPLIGCGKGTSTMNLLRVSTRSAPSTTTEDVFTTVSSSSTDTSTAATSTEASSGRKLQSSVVGVCVLAMVLQLLM